MDRGLLVFGPNNDRFDPGMMAAANLKTTDIGYQNRIVFA
jgi:hypothetical protein